MLEFLLCLVGNLKLEMLVMLELASQSTTKANWMHGRVPCCCKHKTIASKTSKCLNVMCKA